MSLLVLEGIGKGGMLKLSMSVSLTVGNDNIDSVETHSHPLKFGGGES